MMPWIGKSLDIKRFYHQFYSSVRPQLNSNNFIQNATEGQHPTIIEIKEKNRAIKYAISLSIFISVIVIVHWGSCGSLSPR